MSNVDAHGFYHKDRKKPVEVRRFIDKTLRSMGLDESLRLNPALEQELSIELMSVDFSKIDFTSRPLIIAGKKFEIDNGNLIIEEKTQGVASKHFGRTIYEKNADSKGMMMSKSSMSYILADDAAVFSEVHHEQFRYFTDAGVEMSRINLDHEGLVIEDGNFYRQEPEMSENFKQTRCLIDSKNNTLVIPELPSDYRSCQQLDRHPNFIEQVLVKEQKRTDEGEIIFDGATNINSEHGLAELKIVGQLEDFCFTKNLTTGEKFPPRDPEYARKNSITDITTAIKAGAIDMGNGRLEASPLGLKQMRSLAQMSNGRADIGVFTPVDYEKIGPLYELPFDKIKEVLKAIEILPDLTPDEMKLEDIEKPGEDR